MTVPSSVDATLVVTSLLAAIFHLLYRRLRREEFLRWWAWAWTVYSVSIAASWAATQWPAMAMVWFVTGWVHAVLLLRGALAAWDKPWPRRIPWLGTLGVAAALGLANYYWARTTLEDALVTGPRAALFGVVYLISAYAFHDHWRKSGCSATLVTQASCALRGIQFLWSAWASTQSLLISPLLVVLMRTFGGLISQCGIGLGMILLLIQEYRHAERKLLASRERYRQMVETANEGIVLNDAEGRVLFANQRFADMLRVPLADLTGRRPGEMGILDAESVALIEQERQRRRQGLTSRYELCFRLGTKDDLCCVASAAPTYDEEGRFTGSLVMLTDITDLKRAERALRGSETRYRDLFENAGDLVATSDLQGNITSWNRAGERITGYSAEEALRMNVRDLAMEHHRPFIDECVLEPVREGQAHVDAQAKDGRIVNLEISHRTIYDGTVPVGKQAIARDVTARLRWEAQLRQSQKMEAVGRLAGGIAHDFNNSLCVIVGFSDLELGRDDLDAERQYHVEQIKVAALQAGSLTHQLLAFSRQQVLEPKIIDLNGVVSNMMKMLPRLIGEDIHLFFLPSASPWNVEADPGQMEQVVMNLVVNARDAMPHGGTLTLETANAEPSDCLAHQYCCPHVPPGYYVMLAVRDTGIGMDEETKARMFEPFFTTKEKGKGTGLGLATVYGIVEQSGGHMCVRSAPGQGSSFEVYLPRVEQRVEAQGFDAVQPPPRGWETILLMEDEPALRRMVAEILGRAGYTVLAPANAIEALELAHCHPTEIALFFTDLVLPDKSGAQLAAEAAALRPSMRVLFTSGYSDDRIAQHGPREPDQAFIRKPFTSDQLLRKIRDVLEREERDYVTASGKYARL